MAIQTLRARAARTIEETAEYTFDYDSERSETVELQASEQIDQIPQSAWQRSSGTLDQWVLEVDKSPLRSLVDRLFGMSDRRSAAIKQIPGAHRAYK